MIINLILEFTILIMFSNIWTLIISFSLFSIIYYCIYKKESNKKKVPLKKTIRIFFNIFWIISQFFLPYLPYEKHKISNIMTIDSILQIVMENIFPVILFTIFTILVLILSLAMSMFSIQKIIRKCDKNKNYIFFDTIEILENISCLFWSIFFFCYLISCAVISNFQLKEILFNPSTNQVNQMFDDLPTSKVN